MPVPQYELVAALADGCFHSGCELGEKWQVSRTCIASSIKKLDALGLSVFSVRGKGYKLDSRLYLLDKAKMMVSIPIEIHALLRGIEIFPSIGSTNSYLLEKNLTTGEQQSFYQVCFAEMQQNGRGRRGRKWVSPFGHNLYFSIATARSEGAHGIQGLSLVAGLAIAKTFSGIGIKQVGLKWPNDVQINGKKVAGVLVELKGDASGQCQIVLGVGINLKMSVHAMREVEQAWIALEDAGFDVAKRNELAGMMIGELVRNLEVFNHGGFAALRSEWASYDVTMGKNVNVISHTSSVSGIGCGIADDGCLIVNDGEKIIHMHSGEVSLRIGNDEHDFAT